MYVFDVYYRIEGNRERKQKSWLLAWPEEGFELKKEIQGVLSEEHKKNVEIIETDLEEI